MFARNDEGIKTGIVEEMYKFRYQYKKKSALEIESLLTLLLLVANLVTYANLPKN